MNLEQLRRQAKELVRAARAGDEEALARLGDLPPKLASAQLALAREHGYRSWPATCSTVAPTRTPATPTSTARSRRSSASPVSSTTQS